MVPIHSTCPHCLQHFVFEHHFHLYSNVNNIQFMIPRGKANKNTHWYNTGRYFSAAKQALSTGCSNSIYLKKGEVLRKYSLHGENSSLSVVETVHQLK